MVGVGLRFFVKNGLNSIKYQINEFEKKNTYTRILVHLNPQEVIKRIFKSGFFEKY